MQWIILISWKVLRRWRLFVGFFFRRFNWAYTPCLWLLLFCIFFAIFLGIFLTLLFRDGGWGFFLSNIFFSYLFLRHWHLPIRLLRVVHVVTIVRVRDLGLSYEIIWHIQVKVFRLENSFQHNHKFFEQTQAPFLWAWVNRPDVFIFWDDWNQN